MEAIILAVHVVLPILLLMLVGLGARKVGILNDRFIKELNKMIFLLFLPALMFVNVYQTNIQEVLDVRLVVFTVAVTTAVFLISFALVPKFEKQNARRGALIQAMVRGNGAYFGIPVTVVLIGEQYAGLMAIVVAFAAILYNLFSVIALETFRNEKVSTLRILKGVATNPMLLATIVALVFVACGIKIPDMLFGTLKDMSKVTTPLALITLGGSFVFTSAGEYTKQIIAVVLIKLVLIPGMIMPLAIWLNFTHYELGCIFSLIAAPVAVATFAVAQQLEGDDVLAGHLVVFTSLASMLTMFLWIVILGPFFLTI
ncbi:AEC family transporter [Clostridium aminobutyricum]|uniref:AEC family transporter n=1 Tax=Clostridium aminobutyricum TaxID=33953 RepID=A0A939IJ92_CLOAM|nr:AEC family transporter [Clostridium aminobutyricum]MBN7773368.1 AEC family transporter [Clostridium aminobutyricum]